MVVDETKGADGGSPDGASVARPVSRLSKLGIAAVVAVVVALLVGVAALAVHVSRWPALRYRSDWTVDRRNTLDPQTSELLDKLEAKISVDVFFRHQPGPFAAVFAEAQELMAELLREIENSYPDKVELTYHDTGDLAAAEERMRELGVPSLQKVVVSLGQRRVLLDLTEDLAEIDPGNPSPRGFVPATLRRFRGESAFAEAVADVASGEELRVLISTGHGEPGTEPLDEYALSELVSALRAEGYSVGSWNGQRDGGVPEDCTVLIVPGPEQPFSPAEVESVHTFVEGGGRLLAAPGRAYYDGDGSGSDLVRPYGMRISRGIIGEPVVDPRSGRLMDGLPECLTFAVFGEGLAAQHPVTAPLSRGQRRVELHHSRSFDREVAAPNVLLEDLLRSTEYSWRDLPGPNGTLDFALNPGREEGGHFRLAMAARVQPATDSPATAEASREGRVIGVAAMSVLGDGLWRSNRDFVMNAVHWLAARDLRIRIAPKEVTETRLEMRQGPDFVHFTWVAYFGLPGVCLLLGVATWISRRRG